jgi:hypothetical protein
VPELPDVPDVPEVPEEPEQTPWYVMVNREFPQIPPHVDRLSPTSITVNPEVIVMLPSWAQK